MEAKSRTPGEIFNMPQQLLVPLFQRRYLWNEDKQWEPLWRDVERITGRLLENPKEKLQPHFLGAVVLQHVENPTSTLQERTIIDGQQRLTTLQLLMDAIHGELVRVGADLPAARIETLITNGEQFCQKHEEQFKVWPTNKDRPAFNEVMSAPIPVDYKKLTHRKSKLTEAHEFFAARCRDWLASAGEGQILRRAESLEKAIREFLLLVVIDLPTDENSQEIFETLNSRGTELTPADLIKNFIFQRLSEEEEEADIESYYNSYWAPFDELAFWEEEENLGRFTIRRTSAFLGYWLTAQTGEELFFPQVFQRFKSYALYEAKISMAELLKRIHAMAGTYRTFVEAGNVQEGEISRLALFIYRTKVLESNLVKSVVLTLLDPQREVIPRPQLELILDTIESWMTRRALVGLTSKGYNRVMADLVQLIKNANPMTLTTSVEGFFANQQADSTYWPDDNEIIETLTTLPIYRRKRARTRMILEALEDHARGWVNGETSSTGVRVKRAAFAIEHLMPQGWHRHWALTEGVEESDRERRIHTLGNLTLVTKKLNSTLSNSEWEKKKVELMQRDVGLMNKLIVDNSPSSWTETDIEQRTTALIKEVCVIWPVPKGHKSVHQKLTGKLSRYDVWVADLLSVGLVAIGQVLYPKQGKFAGRNSTILSDGRLELEGKIFDSPSGAGYHLRQLATGGWGFWLTDDKARISLGDLREQYIERFGSAAEIAEDDDEFDDE